MELFTFASIKLSPKSQMTWELKNSPHQDIKGKYIREA